jgi:phage RecT family recombinase
MSDQQELVPLNRNPGQFLCEKHRDRIEEALGYTSIRQPKMPLTIETFTSAVANDLLRDRTTGTGSLWRGFQTSPEAAIAAMLTAAQMKLMPGTSYGLYWLIPFKDKGRESVRGEIGYKGYAELAQRHPRVHSIQSVLVFKGERFVYNAGTGKCDHEVDLMGDRSFENVAGGYLRAVITEEATQHAVIDAPLIIPMSIGEILKRRECSQSWKRTGKGSIWGQWPHEQAKKTLMKNGLSHGEVPKDMGLASAIQADGAEDTTPDLMPPAPEMPTRASEARQRLGIDAPSQRSVEPEIGDQMGFALAEDAVEAIGRAETAADLHAIAERSAHFTRSDADMIAEAMERRREEWDR